MYANHANTPTSLQVAPLGAAHPPTAGTRSVRHASGHKRTATEIANLKKFGINITEVETGPEGIKKTGMFINTKMLDAHLMIHIYTVKGILELRWITITLNLMSLYSLFGEDCKQAFAPSSWDSGFGIMSTACCFLFLIELVSNYIIHIISFVRNDMFFLLQYRSLVLGPSPPYLVAPGFLSVT